MSMNPIPDESQSIALLKKYGTPHHIIEHSRQVWLVGRLLGEGLLRNGHLLDMDLLRASCLLHDIGKYPCIRDGGRHDIRGEQILVEEGLPLVGRVVVQHVILRASGEDPVREEHVVYYADKRVVHDKIVDLDERFVYLEATYGKHPDALAGLKGMKDQTTWLEREIFALLDFEPGDVAALLREPERT